MATEIVRNISVHQMQTFLAPKSARGRPRAVSAELMWECLEFMCRTSVPWHLLPTTANYKTVHRTFIQMQRAGVFRGIFNTIRRVYLARRPPRHLITDTSFIKNIRGRDVIGRNPTDRGRNATKLSSITDDRGITLEFVLVPGNQHDQTVLGATLHELPTIFRGLEMFADKGYDSRRNRGILFTRGFRDRILRRGQHRAKNASRKRIRVEHSYAHLKQFRHLRNRYDHLATSYCAFVHIAATILMGQKI